MIGAGAQQAGWTARSLSSSVHTSTSGRVDNTPPHTSGRVSYTLQDTPNRVTYLPQHTSICVINKTEVTPSFVTYTPEDSQKFVTHTHQDSLNCVTSISRDSSNCSIFIKRQNKAPDQAFLPFPPDVWSSLLILFKHFISLIPWENLLLYLHILHYRIRKFWNCWLLNTRSVDLVGTLNCLGTDLVHPLRFPETGRGKLTQHREHPRVFITPTKSHKLKPILLIAIPWLAYLVSSIAFSTELDCLISALLFTTILHFNLLTLCIWEHLCPSRNTFFQPEVITKSSNFQPLLIFILTAKLFIQTCFRVSLTALNQKLITKDLNLQPSTSQPLTQNYYFRYHNLVPCSVTLTSQRPNNAPCPWWHLPGMGNEGSAPSTGESTPVSEYPSLYSIHSRVRSSVESTRAASPMEPPEPDMSHLTAEEVAQIKMVMERAKNMQDEESTRAR